MLTGLNSYNSSVQYNNHPRFGNRASVIEDTARKTFAKFEEFLPEHGASSLTKLNTNVITGLLIKDRTIVPDILEEVAELAGKKDDLQWAANHFRKMAAAHRKNNAQIEEKSRKGIVHIFI